jgi:hypothetical protein
MRKVYVAYSPEANEIKIGSSHNPGRRMGDLERELGIAIYLLASMPGGFRKEKASHARFAAEKTEGEWFRASPKLWAFVAEVRAKECEEDAKSRILWEESNAETRARRTNPALRNTPRTVPFTPEGQEREDKLIRVSFEVLEALAAHRIGFESPDATLRRLLQLPPRKRAA